MRERRYIPYDYPVTPEIIRMKDGACVTTFLVEGAYSSMMNAQSLSALHERRALMGQQLRQDGWTVHHTMIRRPVIDLMETTPEDPLLSAIDKRAQQSLIDDGIFRNTHYVSLIRHGGISPTNIAKMATMRKKEKKTLRLGWAYELEQFALRYEAMMRPFGLNRLTVAKHPSGAFLDEQSELFAEIVNAGFQLPMMLSDEMDSYITCRRKVFKGEAFVATGRGQNTWGSMIAIDNRGYPNPVRPTCLDPVASLPYPMIISQSFSADDSIETGQSLDWQEQRLENSYGAAADDLIREIMADRRKAASGITFGLHHFSVCPLVTQDVDGAEGARIANRLLTSRCNEIMAALATSGIIAKREAMNTHSMFYAQLPGALHDAGPRRRRVNSRNWAAFAAFNRENYGRPTDNKWGECIARFKPLYSFNFHANEVGHFAALGKTGEGKTLMVLYLALMSQRSKKPPRVIVLDVNNSAEVPIRYAGGHYQDIKLASHTGYNPFWYAVDDESIAKSAAFLMQMLLITGASDTSDARDRVLNAVHSACSIGPEYRNIDEIAAFLTNSGEGSLGHAIAPWKSGGRLNWVFGAKKDCLRFDSQFTGINLSSVLDEKEIGEIITAYLIDRIRAAVTGDPLIIYLEESWKTLQKPAFLSASVDLEKTARARDTIIGFGTQDGKDLSTSPAAHQLISNLATLICAPHPDAGPSSYDGFQLTEKQVQAICGLPFGSRQYFIKTGTDAVVIDGDLSGLGDHIELLSSNPRKAELCAKVRKEYGDDPAAWAPHFLEELRHEKNLNNGNAEHHANGLRLASG